MHKLLETGQVDTFGAVWVVLSGCITLEGGVGDWGSPDLAQEA